MAYQRGTDAGFFQRRRADLNSVESFRSQLEATGLVHGYSLIPFALLVVLALMRVNAVVAMLFTVIAAVAVTYLHSTPDLRQLGAWFYGGYKLEGEAFKDIAKLISRGGLEVCSLRRPSLSSV